MERDASRSLLPRRQACVAEPASSGPQDSAAEFAPFTVLRIQRHHLNVMIRVSSTSTRGVRLICGPDGPLPAMEKAIATAPLGHACLEHQHRTPLRVPFRCVAGKERQTFALVHGGCKFPCKFGCLFCTHPCIMEGAADHTRIRPTHDLLAT